MYFDVKFDLRRKEQLVTGGNITVYRNGYYYYGVVNIDTVRKALFLGNINDPEVDCSRCR